MPVTEIDEVELMNLRRLQGTAAKILSNPKAKKLLEQAHKLVDPNAITPSLDQEREIQEPVSKALEEVAALKKQLEDEKAERAKTEKLTAIQSKIDQGKMQLRKEGWTDEGIAGVEKLMDEKGLLDPLDAAAIFEKLHPPQQPVNPSGSGAWNFLDGVQDGEADLKKLIETKGESSPLLDKMSREALAEVRGQSRR